MATKSFLSIISIIAWGASLVVLQIPSPLHLQWVIALLLLGPLLLFPFAIQRLSGDYPPILYFLCALLLTGAFLIDQGWTAFFLSIPWLLLAAYYSLEGKRYLNTSDSPIIQWLKFGAGIFWTVGAAWASLDRLGWVPPGLGFSPIIILLTAAHFHFAGFLLPLLTAWSFPKLTFSFKHRIGQLVLWGIPLTAIGITLSSQGLALWVESVAATVMAMGGFLVGVIYLFLGIQHRSQWSGMAWLAGGFFLCGGMILAFLYGWHLHLQFHWLTIPWMYAVHGSLNVLSLGVLLAGWRFYYR